MTQTPARPKLARKVTPKDEANRDAALNEGIKLTLDGESFVLRVGDITPALAREIRKETGRSFNRLMADVTEDPDIDVIAEAIWVARRIAGDNVRLDDIAVSYELILGDKFDISAPGAPESEEVDPDSPEA